MLASLALAIVLSIPAPEAEVARIGLGSCADQDQPQPIWEAILRDHPDTFVFLGDNIYASYQGRLNKPEQYAKLAAIEGFRKLIAQTRVLAVWDDHDFGVNDGGADYPHKVQAQKEFCDFWKVPAGSPRRTRDGIYDSVVLGPEGRRVQFILLDTRFNRSPLNREANVDGSYNAYLPTLRGTMLGEPQWRWFAEQLQVPARVRIVVSSIQVVPEDHMFEKWANLPGERKRLFETIRKSGAEGLFFVSGDRHLAEISMMDAGVGYPIYDLTASALTESRLDWRMQEPNRHRVGTMNYGNNYGWVEIDWQDADPSISLQIKDDRGRAVLRQDIRLSWLKSGRIQQ